MRQIGGASKSVVYVLLLSIGQLAVAAASADGKSAWREPGHSYLEYLLNAKEVARRDRTNEPTFPITAVDSASKFSQGNLPEATSWSSLQELRERFEYVRDWRGLIWPTKPDFRRRSSWLYPDDGCYARAALAQKNLHALKITPASKVFAFGNLHIESKNAADGAITWWYHVAAIVEVDGKKFVLDPAISPQAPLELRAWLAQMSSDPDSLEVAICGSGTYTPYDACNKVSDGQEVEAQHDQLRFLDLEWERIEFLNRDPEAELGESPPWKSNQNLTELRSSSAKLFLWKQQALLSAY